MSARIDSSCASLGLRIDPRSPPVQVTTRTRSPSATYRAIVAAPLLDSSSGCACTAMRRIGSLTVSPSPENRPDSHTAARAQATRYVTHNETVTAADDETRAALADRYGLGPGAVTRRRRWLAVGVLAG